MIRLRPAVLILVLAAAGCAGKRTALPSGDGTPFPGFAAVHEEATRDCAAARTVVADLGMSGRAGGTRLRGTVTSALAEEGAIRLEGVAFGRAIFILAGRSGRATLLLLREDRVLRSAPPEQIVEALAGVPLTPADLRAAVAGCGLVTGAPANGRMFTNDWAAVDIGDTVTYLRRVEGRWRVGGATRGGLILTYDTFTAGLPGGISIRSTTRAGEQVADIRLRVSGLELNTAIDPKAFVLDVPADADPLTLEELRRSGPLGERR
jgi:hypothetical protein